MSEPAQIQFLRGKKETNDSFVGPEGGVTVDTDNWEFRIHDGVQPGGHPSPSKENTKKDLKEVKQNLSVDKSIDKTELLTIIKTLAKRVNRLESVVEKLQNPPNTSTPPIDIIISPPETDIYAIEKQYVELRQKVFELSKRIRRAMYTIRKTLH